MRYVFILGSNSALCKSELENYFAASGWKFEIADESRDAVVAEIENFDSKIISDLGGTIKIAEVLDEKTDLEKLKLPKIKEKLFSVSAYGAERAAQKKFAMKIKRQNKGSKFFQGKSAQTSAVEILKKDLLEKDFVLLKTESKIFLGKTISVYDPFDFKKRDMERPFQRPLQGMPIRIAKILLNLARVTENSKVLDPFCGYGTIVQEACSISAEAFGTDLDDYAIKAAEGNMNWFQGEYGKKCRFIFSCTNAFDLVKVFGKEKFDAVVSEPNLGPPLKKTTEDEAFGIIEELEDFYSKSLPPIVSVLKKGGRLSIIFPKIRAGKHKFFEMDLKRVLPESLKLVHEFEDARENQTTIRKIFVFEKAE